MKDVQTGSIPLHPEGESSIGEHLNNLCHILHSHKHNFTDLECLPVVPNLPIVAFLCNTRRHKLGSKQVQILISVLIPASFGPWANSVSQFPHLKNKDSHYRLGYHKDGIKYELTHYVMSSTLIRKCSINAGVSPRPLLHECFQLFKDDGDCFCKFSPGFLSYFHGFYMTLLPAHSSS